MAPSLVVCPECACHVRASEPSCPLCSAQLAPTPAGTLPRTAAAIAMGLAVVAVVPGCGDSTGDSGSGQGGEVTAEYGIGPTGGGSDGSSTTTTSTGSTGEGGAGGSTGDGGAGGEITAEYGVGPTMGGSGG